MRFCEELLKTNGFGPIVTAPNGHEGIRLYRENPTQFGLIISDVEMPLKNGFDMVREVVAFSAPTPNILMMSGSYTKAPHDLPDICAVLAKPFESWDFINAVEQCLDAVAA